jgi:CheY-like chemotaxis protein
MCFKIKKGGQMNKKKILVVDDDMDVITSIKAVLEKHGHAVETARSETECLERYAFFEPDIIFLDMMMERMDSGFRVCKDIRERDQEVKIYMLSSVGSDNAGTHDIHEVGFNGSLEKPISPDYLLNIIAQA